jgi:hypothetical protein
MVLRDESLPLRYVMVRMKPIVMSLQFGIVVVQFRLLDVRKHCIWHGSTSDWVKYTWNVRRLLVWGWNMFIFIMRIIIGLSYWPR